ncbi:MerR family transcriptional regulator [Nocardia sp. CDC159]|uniref:MerR family transcriptional regulator n=1 Tax=Nocardia pulmonis TaxID=2951408 RepID=A0A9X2E616_9NOCA|nr:MULTISPECIES: MerR family transcriptional regulator [Nocardia]MCM6773748.1 MerR family transcriptional regulator [Nocardia pulmonis]MCM6786635.1 MerR family transcriptional regulator [Nocardia sp. CDC159]
MPDLIPIRQVADHFALPISTLHYWERRGLITSSRRSGRRCYDRDQIYRIALIRLWRGTGQLPVEEIAAVLDAPDWRDIVTARIAAIDTERARLDTARAYLRRLLDCPHDAGLEHCDGFRAMVDFPAPR